MKKRWLNKSVLEWVGIFGFCVIITLIIAPEFTLVSARYKPDDIITETIVLSEDVVLEDTLSTLTRRTQAEEDLLVVYDHDPRLGEELSKKLQNSLNELRKDLALSHQKVSDTSAAVYANTVEQLETIAQQKKSLSITNMLKNEQNLLIELLDEQDQGVKLEGKFQQQQKKMQLNLRKIQFLLTDHTQIEAQLVEKLKILKARKKESNEVLIAAQTEMKQLPAVLKDRLEKTLGIVITEASYKILYDTGFSQQLEAEWVYVLQLAYQEKIVDSLLTIKKNKQGIQLQNITTEKMERFENLDLLHDVSGMQDHLRNQLTARISEKPLPYYETLLLLTQSMIKPNVTENKGASRRYKEETLANIAPVYFNFKKGHIIAQSGEQATPQQVEVIRALSQHRMQNPKYRQILGTLFLLLLVTLLLRSFVLQRKNIHIHSSSALLLGMLVLMTLLVGQGLLVLAPALHTIYDFIPVQTYHYLVPVTLAAMLGSVLIGFEFALVVSFAIAMCMAVLLGNSWEYFLFALLSSFVASIPVAQHESRFVIWQQGLRVSLFNIPLVVVLSLIEQASFDMGFAFSLIAAGMSGFLAVFLTITLLPIFEKIFDITTNLRLLELGNVHHPALKELAVRAPGTYQHSIVVGNLCDAAADGIQANALLARVASYYHDMGKMLCPQYFVENQLRTNFHDDLPANTSARIIINHVRDGLEIARRFKLGHKISEIIEQHHGKSLVRYFFDRAKKEGEKSNIVADELAFRYPGPKPSTKEAALVMTADVTEAATRSLNEFAPENIRNLVQKLTTTIYSDGQLDESGLTFNDLSYIEKTFIKMLVSVHHHRIAYPGQTPDASDR